MNEDEQEKLRANPGYAVAQLAKALLSKGEDAAKHVQQWQQVLVGMAQGSLQIGSRTPLTSTPPWVTLEVVHGGFATGNLAAGGKLKPHEIKSAHSKSGNVCDGRYHGLCEVPWCRSNGYGGGCRFF